MTGGEPDKERNRTVSNRSRPKTRDAERRRPLKKATVQTGPGQAGAALTRRMVIVDKRRARENASGSRHDAGLGAAEREARILPAADLYVGRPPPLLRSLRSCADGDDRG